MSVGSRWTEVASTRRWKSSAGGPARPAAASRPAAEHVASVWSEIRSSYGPTEFLGYEQTAAEARVLAVIAKLGRALVRQRRRRTRT